jgi:hypothetical protein
MMIAVPLNLCTAIHKRFAERPLIHPEAVGIRLCGT